MSGPIKFARTVHLVSAFWTLALALLIFGDVAGRSLLSQPIPGTKEIIQNSVVAITFLQLPLAIYSGSMLRTSIFADALPPGGAGFCEPLARCSALPCFSGWCGAPGQRSRMPIASENMKVRARCEYRHGRCAAQFC